ncbi:hypothetical protein GIB67_007494 [Kingdonia uniflora]|uniref:F-box domain-containing protein n=1 Tax=Kingdonia uniflora TaxID=39325 RepID=A0A7J7LW75_9MAGN|nr:hypothetical protein GIB67_007494 [Kingdonia uniflora]
MGNSLSNPTTIGPGLGDIPESCVACVFMYLTPPEICNLARLNQAFRGAASSDYVWESKLPSNYQSLLDLIPQSHQTLRKKDVFALLSKPIPFDGGNKEVWLDRVTGGVCMSISARAMTITLIDDHRYWEWITDEESRWEEVAFLVQVWWFEVSGAVKFQLPPGAYTLLFRLHLGKFTRRLGRLGRRVCNFDKTHGWDVKPVKFEFSISDGQQASSESYLDDSESYDMNYKRGCWIEHEVGEFIVSNSELVTDIKFSMKQIDCTHSKGGLCFDSVFIVPSYLRKRRKEISS